MAVLHRYYSISSNLERFESKKNDKDERLNEEKKGKDESLDKKIFF